MLKEINNMSSISINIKKEDKILIIAPHPDDECIGCGGLLSLYPEKCSVVVMTDGSQGNDNVKSEQEADIRKNQFIDEMTQAGIADYVWLGYPDGGLMGIKDCTETIKIEKYTKIFLTWRDDNHPDHTAAFMYSLEVIKKRCNAKTEIYEYEVHVPFHDVTHYLDITDVMQYKEQLIRCHKDQIKISPYDKRVNSLARYRACQLNQADCFFETYRKVDIDKEDGANEELIIREKTLQKYKQFYGLFARWISLYQKKIYIDSWLHENNVKNISVYGYGVIGKLVVNEIITNCKNINIVEILDLRNVQCDIDGINIVMPEEGKINVDLMIVTALYDYKDIEKELKNMGYLNVISIQTILEQL